MKHTLRQCGILKWGNFFAKKSEREKLGFFNLFSTQFFCLSFYSYSLSETNEGSEEVTIIEELLIDLLQLVHGTIKKLIPPEDSQDEDGNNEDSNNTLTASGSSMGGLFTFQLFVYIC